MAEAATSYPFSSGDRLDNRNTYFYTPFGGDAFMQAWQSDRARLAAQLPPATAAAPAAQTSAPPAGASAWQTAALCEQLLHAIARSTGSLDTENKQLLDQLIRKFETTKRVHAAYRCSDFRAIDPKAYREPALYLRLAELFDAVHARTGSLQCLNALLKILDTLTGLAPSLDHAQGARLARLLASERRHIETLAERLAVAS